MKKVKAQLLETVSAIAIETHEHRGRARLTKRDLSIEHLVCNRPCYASMTVPKPRAQVRSRVFGGKFEEQSVIRTCASKGYMIPL